MDFQTQNSKVITASFLMDLYSQSTTTSMNRYSSSSSVTSPADTSAEEIIKLNEKIKTLESEKYHLTKELHLSVIQSTHLLEHVVKLEASDDRLKMKLNQFKDHMGIDLELLSASMDLENNPHLKEELLKVQKLTQSVRDVSCQIEDEDAPTESSYEENAANEEMMNTPDSRAVAQKHVLRQSVLYKELNDINRLLTSKLALAEEISKSDSIRQKYEEMAKKWKAKLEQLEKEKCELRVTLQDVQANSNAAKVAEQHRQRLRELEQQMSQLKKKITEQSKIVKVIESHDKRMSRLNIEIQNLKQHRWKLTKQMKEENLNVQKWKIEKDQEVLKLQQQMLRSHELDLKVSMREPQYHLAQLMEDRKDLTERLRFLSNELEDDFRLQTFSCLTVTENGEPDFKETSFEDKEIKEEMTSIKLAIELKNLYIREWQQKILDTDQGKSTRQSLHAMNKAKCPFKFLLDQKELSSSGSLKSDLVVDETPAVKGEKENKTNCRTEKALVKKLKSIEDKQEKEEMKRRAREDSYESLV